MNASPYALFFRGKDEVLLRIEDGSPLILSTAPVAARLIPKAALSYAGPALAHAAYRLQNNELAPTGHRFAHPRELLASPSPAAADLARDVFGALGFLNWLSRHRYCGCCAAPLRPHPVEPALCCPACSRLFYPQMSPAIIVRVTRPDDGRILLARHRNRNQDFWTLLAGFVNLGENADDCVRREVREETGLSLASLRLLDTAYWPFPNSFMLAYLATAAPPFDPIRPQPEELLDARWFSLDDLPSTLPPGSLAHRLIHLPPSL